MDSIFRTVVRFRLLVLAVAAAIMTLGFVQLGKGRVDVLPEFTPPYAEVQTEALGLSADEVEQLITVPLEADLLNGVEGVDVIRSQSVPGLSSIVLVFAPGTDVYRARQLVEERLTQAHALPNVSKPPTLLQPLSSSNRVLMIGLSSDKLTAIDQSVIARWTVRPRLMGVPGVANVSIWGMRDQQLQVQVDPERLRQRGVTLGQVIRSAGNAQVVSPLSFLEASTPGTGGFIETPQQRLQVRHLLEKIADPAELGKVPVEGTGGRLRLADVADIRVDHQPLIGDAIVSGGAGEMLVVEKLPGASTLEVTDGVEDALETLHPGLTGMRTDVSLFRPASYIEAALDNLALTLGAGALLMLLGLFAIRFHWRAVLMAVVTIPLSLLTAVVVLDLLGQGFNALVLAGLAGALAVVVDESVVSSERVVRRLRHRGPDEAPLPTATLIQQAYRIRRPLVYATLIVILAIVPLAVLGGRPGAFFHPLVLAYALSVTAAMLVALFVTPALSTVLFARWSPTPRQSAKSSRLGARYQTALQRFSRKPRALVAVGVVAVLGLLTLPFLGLSALPTFQDRDVLVRLEGAPGTSNTRMTEIATDVTRQLKDLPGVANVGAHVGRSVTGDRVTNVSSSDVWVSLTSNADFDATMDAVNAAVQEVAGVAEREVVTYSAQKMRDVGALLKGQNSATGNGLALLTGSDRSLVVRLFGQDLDVLRREAERVRQVMSGVDGVVAPKVVAPPSQPNVEIEVDLQRAQAFGVTPGAVRRAEATLLQGIQVGSVFQEQKVFDVVVQGVPSTRRSVADVRNLLIDRPGGGHVRLGQVADVRVAQTPAVINRDAVSRRLDIEADVSGRSAGSVASEVESRLAGMSFPLEYHAEVLRDSAGAEIGLGRVLGFAVAAAIAALLLLQAAFRSWRLAALVFAVLPVSLVGGLVVALLDGAHLWLGSLVGLLAVLGLAVRSDVLLVTGVRALQRETGRPLDAELVRRSAGERVAPVVTTAVAVALLMLPIAIVGAKPGLEILHPMALVLLGGLVTSTLVTLFVLPALYAQMVTGSTRRTASRGQPADPFGDSEPGAMAATLPHQRSTPAEPPDGGTIR
jgi:Cu/Ag efflux pump CusA